MAYTVGQASVLGVSITPHGDSWAIDVFVQRQVLDGETVVDVFQKKTDAWPLLNPGQRVKALQVYQEAVEAVSQ